MATKLNEHSICANQKEKNHLAAVTAGFALTIALTITAWVAALSFLSGDWIDWLSKAPPWIYCIACIVVLWPTLSRSMYLGFRASNGKSAEPQIRNAKGTIHVEEETVGASANEAQSTRDAFRLRKSWPPSGCAT